MRYSIGDIVVRKNAWFARRNERAVRVTHVRNTTCCGSPVIEINALGAVCATEYAPVVKKLRDRVCIWICKED